MDDEVFEALDLDPEAFRTEGGAVNRAKLRAALLHPAEYLPADHWLLSSPSCADCARNYSAIDPSKNVFCQAHLLEIRPADREQCERLAKNCKSFSRRAAHSTPVPHALNGMPKTLYHDEGAAAQCFYCKRYTLDLRALRDHKPLVCTCGKSDGWSGSFQRPTDGDHWHGNWPDMTMQPTAIPSTER